MITINGRKQSVMLTYGGIDMITINGRKQSVMLTYEEIISRAGYKPDRIISVTYRTQRPGDEQRSGIMVPGQSVVIEDNMIFNACDTGNA